MRRHTNKQLETGLLSIGTVAITFILAFALSVVVSIITFSLLTHNSLFSAARAGVIASLVQGAIGAIAASFVVYELRKNIDVGIQKANIDEERFLLEYNLVFTQDENMQQVEHSLELWMEAHESTHENSAPLNINDKNRQRFINYLVYLEGLAPLIFKGVLRLETIDDLFAYRFFLAVNNPELQKDQLFRYPEYFRGCFRLYERWKEYRKKHCLPITLEEYSLDKWDHYGFYSNSKVKLARIEKNDASKKTVRSVAELIYATDEYIYPAVFGNIRTARNTIPRLISASNSFFSCNNMRIACIDGKVVGVALVLDKPFSTHVEQKLLEKLPSSFIDVNENYFKNVSKSIEEQPYEVYIACLCVRTGSRHQGIGRMLLTQIIKEYGKDKDIWLDVLSDNVNAIRLYEQCGFRTVKQSEGFSLNDGTAPLCLNMRRKKNSHSA